MSLPEFLRSLFDDGRVTVPPPGDEIPAEEAREADGVLAAFEATYRYELAGTAPQLAPPAAGWAAAQFYAACQFTMFRDAGLEAIERRLQPAPRQDTGHDPAAVAYSVDLTFRFLPDLFQLARAKAEDDPLLESLKRWAVRWPLSSVGMPGVEAVDPTPLAQSDAVLQLYVDRILARGDVGRLDFEPARDFARRAVGIFPELAPSIAAAVTPSSSGPME